MRNGKIIYIYTVKELVLHFHSYSYFKIKTW